MVLVVKNPPTNSGNTKEMWVQSLGRKDPLEESMTTHSSILAWRIPWKEEPGGLQSMGLKESNATHTRFLSHARLFAKFSVNSAKSSQPP